VVNQAQRQRQRPFEKGVAGALGRRRGARKGKNPSRKPGHPAIEECLKEQHTQVLSERRAPEPAVPKKNRQKAKKPKEFRRLNPQRHVDRKLNILIHGGKPLKKRTPRVKNPRIKLIRQKWQLTKEPWNLKRSPRLRRLRKALNQVVRGQNPFYKFKDLFKSVEIRTLGRYNRVMSILKDGLVISTKSIGIRVTAQIRKVKRLSFRDVEFLISKLPYWATSYSHAQMCTLAVLAGSYMPVRPMRSSSPNLKADSIPPPGPRNPWCVHPRTSRHRTGERPKSLSMV
jgi:hypothetical protein